MKKTLLSLWLSLLAAGTATAAGPTFTPVTQLEVGKTYIFENCRAKDYEYRYLCDVSAGNDLEVSKTLNPNCYWTVMGGTGETLIITNNVTKSYLFSGTSSRARSSAFPTNIYIFQGKTYTSSIGLSITNNTNASTFLNAYNHNTYTCLYTFDAGSEWYAYEVDNDVNLDSIIVSKNGNFSYIIDSSNAYISGIGSGFYTVDNLIIPNYITHDGVDYPVIAITNSAFNNLSGLTGTLKIGENITIIDNYAFQGCYGFSKVEFPESLTYIGTSAFKDCRGLTCVDFHEGLTNIGTSAFQGCSGLNCELALPKSLTSIGAYAFKDCSQLIGNLILPEGLTSINDYTFCNCSHITGNLVLPQNITSIGNSAFNSCGFTGNLILPQNLTSIGSDAFYECSGFTGSLILPQNLTSIGGSAFHRCIGFTGDLIIPEGITEIYAYTFFSCIGLNGTLVLPTSLTSIGYAFPQCNNISKVISKSAKLPTCNTDAFSCQSNATLMVPESGIMAYKLNAPWSSFKEITTIEPLSAIAFAEPTAVCPLDGTVQLKIEKTPMYASGDITYMSSNPAIASVDANGVVTGHSLGSTAIIAMSGTLVASCIVNVENPLPPVISAETIEMEAIVGKVGESIEIRATIIPEDVTDPTINWISSNPDVAAVDADGKVWFNAAGSATITAECQGHEFSVPFKIEEVMAHALNVFPVEAVGGIGHQFSLLALHEPENTTDKSVTWESSDPSIASVDSDGRVELTGVGSAQITARSGEHSAISDITVKEDTTVGLTEMASSGIIIDIVSGGITICNAPEGASIAVYTIDGKVVNGAIVESTETHLSLTTGIYIVKITPDTIAKVLIK